MIKVNVDAALFEIEWLYGCGAVACNSVGSLTEARCSFHTGSLDVGSAEAMSLKEAFRWVKDQP